MSPLCICWHCQHHPMSSPKINGNFLELMLGWTSSHYLIWWWSKIQVATGRWFSQGIPVSSTNKTDRYDITEILLKVALNTISLNQNLTFKQFDWMSCKALLINNYFVVWNLIWYERTWWFSTKFMIFMSMGNPRWPPLQDKDLTINPGEKM